MKGDKFSERIWAACPARLPQLVEQAAARQCMSKSEYVRRSIVERLKADGLDPATAEATAA